MVCNMYVVDPSIAVEGEPQTPQQELLRNGIEVLMFSTDPTVFPRLQKPGDFIRFHRVEVRSANLLCCAAVRFLQPLGANKEMEWLSF